MIFIPKPESLIKIICHKSWIGESPSKFKFIRNFSRKFRQILGNPEFETSLSPKEDGSLVLDSERRNMILNKLNKKRKSNNEIKEDDLLIYNFVKNKKKELLDYKSNLLEFKNEKDNKIHVYLVLKCKKIYFQFSIVIHYKDEFTKETYEILVRNDISLLVLLKKIYDFIIGKEIDGIKIFSLLKNLKEMKISLAEIDNGRRKLLIDENTPFYKKVSDLVKTIKDISSFAAESGGTPGVNKRFDLIVHLYSEKEKPKSEPKPEIKSETEPPIIEPKPKEPDKSIPPKTEESETEPPIIEPKPKEPDKSIPPKTEESEIKPKEPIDVVKFEELEEDEENNPLSNKNLSFINEQCSESYSLDKLFLFFSYHDVKILIVYCNILEISTTYNEIFGLTLGPFAMVNAACASMGGGNGVNGAICKMCPEIATLGKKKHENDLKVSEALSVDSPADFIQKTGAKEVVQALALDACDFTEEKKRNDVPKATRAVYYNSLKSTNQETIVFPSLGTGLFGCDVKMTSSEAMQVTKQYIDEGNKSKKTIIFTCFLERKDIFCYTLAAIRIFKNINMYTNIKKILEHRKISNLHEAKKGDKRKYDLNSMMK